MLDAMHIMTLYHYNSHIRDNTCIDHMGISKFDMHTYCTVNNKECILLTVMIVLLALPAPTVQFITLHFTVWVIVYFMVNN